MEFHGTWHEAADLVRRATGGSVFGLDPAYVNRWTDSKPAPWTYFGSITLFFGDDLAEISRDSFQGRVRYRLRYVKRAQFDPKKGYEHVQEIFSGMITALRGRATFFRALADAIRQAGGVDQYGYWSKK